MQAAVGLTNLAQNTLHHYNALRWSEIDYYLQVRQVHIDTQNNMREDIRDLYDMHKGQIDNALIVSTLMLTMGFGFVVEGTFPPKGEPENQWEVGLRVFYSVVAALALICPFLSMLSLMECRRRLDYFMDRFTHEFYDKMKQRTDFFLDDSSSSQKIQESVSRVTHDLPCWFPRPAPLKPRPGQPVSTISGRLPAVVDDMRLVFKLHHDCVDWWQNWCAFVYRLSKLFHWGGMVSNVGCCAILLGLRFSAKYPESPWMWRCYVLVVVSGLLVVLPGTCFCRRRGPTTDGYAQYKPNWMVRDDAQVLQGPLLEGGCFEL
eukprot:TRINITY_DN30922_c2_g2_i1.p1 TRINITY_DN30922_c2_g2~~TRINITY_DN30922_c2_g2_i1.p1  ORF type:complete len:318 (-),score=35.86 TRINITY_DN30922_c2_g2_i1:349-1302(-)